MDEEEKCEDCDFHGHDQICNLCDPFMGNSYFKNKIKKAEEKIEKAILWLERDIRMEKIDKEKLEGLLNMLKGE